MRRLLFGTAAAIAVAAWIWLDVLQEYRWADTVKRELESNGFTITDEQRVGDLALPWTWVQAPVKKVSFQRILTTNSDGLIYGIDGYLRLDNNGRTEHAVWLRKTDCNDGRFAQLSLNQTEENFQDFEQIEAALSGLAWISRASIEDKATWQAEWFDHVIRDYCL